MHGTTNLLSTSAKDLVDFSRKTLKILFTAEELKTRLLPPQRDHLKRRTLDEERFNKMIGKNVLFSLTSFISPFFI